MKLKFTGDRDGDGPDVLTMYGLTFHKNGSAVEVAGEAETKLSRNSHFVEVKAGRPRKHGSDNHGDAEQSIAPAGSATDRADGDG